MSQQQKVWYSILFIILLLLLLRFWPKAGYGLAAITVLVLLFNLMKRR